MDSSKRQVSSFIEIDSNLICPCFTETYVKMCKIFNVKKLGRVYATVC